MFADIGNVTEIPGDKVVDLVKRGECYMDGIGQKFSMKNAARDITFGEDGDFFV